MVRISVIMPVYNVEDYLKESIESILNQSFGDFEVICIDDGSTDSSLNILRDYEKKDARVRVFSQSNNGAGASRNTAIPYATGEYVYFMDSDDYLDLDAFERLNDFIDGKDFDFIMFKVSNFIEKSGERIDDDYYNMPYLKDRVGLNHFSYEDVSDFALDLCVCPPGNLFKREFISDIRFPEGLLFEDNVFFTHALFKAERIYFMDEFLYNRRKRLDSTTAPVTVKSLDTIAITDMLLDLCKKYGHDHRKELYYRIFHNIYQIFKKADENMKDEFFEKIKANYLKYTEKWEMDDYFNDNLKDEYRHMFRCAVKSHNARSFESCVDGFNDNGRLNKLRRRFF